MIFLTLFKRLICRLFDHDLYIRYPGAGRDVVCVRCGGVWASRP